MGSWYHVHVPQFFAPGPIALQTELPSALHSPSQQLASPLVTQTELSLLLLPATTVYREGQDTSETMKSQRIYMYHYHCTIAIVPLPLYHCHCKGVQTQKEYKAHTCT